MAMPESGGEEGTADPPLVEEPPNQEGACIAKEAAEREGAQWGHTPGLWEKPAGRLSAGEGPALERAGHKWEKREPGRHGAQWNQAGTRPWRAGGGTSKYCGTFLLK